MSDVELIEASNRLCEYAEKRLPDGFRLELRVEAGESSLTVYDPDGNDLPYETEKDESAWASAVEAAIRYSRMSSDN